MERGATVAAERATGAGTYSYGSTWQTASFRSLRAPARLERESGRVRPAPLCRSRMRRKIRVSIYRFLRLAQVFNLFDLSIITLPVSNYGKCVVPTVPQERTPGGLGGLATVRSGARHCRTALGPADSSRRSTSSESGTGGSGGLGRGLVVVRPRVCSIPFEPKIGEALTLGRAGRKIG